MENVVENLYLYIFYEYFDELIRQNKVKKIKRIIKRKKLIKVIKQNLTRIKDEYKRYTIVYCLINKNPEQYYYLLKELTCENINVMFCIIYNLKDLLEWFWNMKREIKFLYNISIFYIAAYYRRNDIIEWMYEKNICYIYTGGIIQCSIIGGNLELIKWYDRKYSETLKDEYLIRTRNIRWTKIKIWNKPINKELQKLEEILNEEKRTHLTDFLFKYSNKEIINWFYKWRYMYNMKFPPYNMIYSAKWNNRMVIEWYHEKKIEKYNKRIYDIYFKWKYGTSIKKMYEIMMNETTNKEIKDILLKKMIK